MSVRYVRRDYANGQEISLIEITADSVAKLLEELDVLDEKPEAEKSGSTTVINVTANPADIAHEVVQKLGGLSGGSCRG